MSTPRPILLINSVYRPSIGGIENSLHYIAKALIERGERVLVACSDHGPSGRLPRHDSIDGVEVHRYANFGRWINFLGLTPTGDFLRARSHLRELAKQQPFAGVIARQQGVGLAAKQALPHTPLIYVPASLSAHLNLDALRSPFANSLKEAIYSRIHRGLLLPQQSKLQRECLREADAVVVFSENMKRQVQESVPNLSNRIWVHPPGVDSGRFQPGANKAALRAELGLPAHACLALVVGRLIRAKGYDLAIKALASIDAKALALVIVGSGGEGAALRRKAEAAGVAGRVHFVPATSEPERYYACADLYLMPSRYESFGQSILEAMSAGLPVIAYRNTAEGGVRTASEELVEHARDGFLCDIDGEGLAGPLRHYLSLGTEARAQLGHQARSKVLGRYTWRALTEFLLERMRWPGARAKRAEKAQSTH
jgi:glycosyltransferase involved in cell wall biosynthesis